MRAYREREDLVIEVSMTDKNVDQIIVLDKTIIVTRRGTPQKLPARISQRMSPKDENSKMGSVILRATLPIFKEDFDVTTAPIKVGDTPVSPKTVKFTYADRWTVVPLNGC